MNNLCENHLGIDSFTRSRFSSDQHRLIMTFSQHIVVSIIRNGKNMRRHFGLSLSFVKTNDKVIVYWKPLKM